MVKVDLNESDVWIVSWIEDDKHIRSHTFDSELAAKKYALQVECRLEIDAYKRELERHRALNSQRDKCADDQSSKGEEGILNDAKAA